MCVCLCVRKKEGEGYRGKFGRECGGPVDNVVVVLEKWWVDMSGLISKENRELLPHFLHENSVIIIMTTVIG